MSDNITREPYRNAWYKQLSDAVKKHDEEIAEMTPHLVPDVEEGDNGKILIAGEEGAFDWGQPPEELPIITESDEGKVLKVDEGVPKWLEDTDNEYLLVTVTRSGTSPNYTYTADKTYAEILTFSEKGKVVVVYNNVFYTLMETTTNDVRFLRNLRLYGWQLDTNVNMLSYLLNPIITISASSVTLVETKYNICDIVNFVDNTALSDEEYNIVKSAAKDGHPAILVGYHATLQKALIFRVVSYTVNYSEIVLKTDGFKVTIGSDKVPHVTELPTDLLVTVTESSGTYSADHTFNEISNALDNSRNVFAIFGTNFYVVDQYLPSTGVIFVPIFNNYGKTVGTYDGKKVRAVQYLIKKSITMLANNSISFEDAQWYSANFFYIDNGSTISQTQYDIMKTAYGFVPSIVCTIYNGEVYQLSNMHSPDLSTFEFTNVNAGIKLTIGSNKVAIVTEIPKLPTPPSTDGTYTLQCTVSSGTPTYSWV